MSISDLCSRVALCLTALLALASAACATPVIAIRGEIAHPVTADGWPLTIEHFAPPPGVAVRPRPVVLCPGVLTNRRFFELEGEASLPLVLSRAGFDVWLVDLRGRPDAGAPGVWFGHHTYDYDIDDFIRYDADTIVTYVLSQTHARDVAWVGHSMGGMIAYGRFGALHDPRVGALVTVGSPGLFGPASRALLRGVEAGGALSVLPVAPVESLASLEGHLGLPLEPKMLRDVIFAKENLPAETYTKLEEVAVNDAANRELRQFILSVRRGEFVSADGRVSYTEGLAAIHAPTLVVMGRADELADPLLGRVVLERLGSTDKQLVIAGKAEGFVADFGHVDLMVGPRARRDVFPLILGWLVNHDGH